MFIRGTKANSNRVRETAIFQPADLVPYIIKLSVLYLVICLGRGAELHVAQLIPLPLTISCSGKSRLVLVLPFWYRWPG